MRVGLRTIKTVVSATLALELAILLNLEFPATAAIIAILSVSNTKKSTIRIGLSRLLSLTVATLVAVLLFNFLGHSPLIFGLYLIIFIPIAIQLKAEEGIVVSSVLITHLLVAETITFNIILNGYLLMIIGVGFALLMNIHMPDLSKQLEENQILLEAKIRLLALGIVNSVRNNKRLDFLIKDVGELLEFTAENIRLSERSVDNRIFSSEYFYLDYFRMRQVQLLIFQEILQDLQKISIEPQFFEGLSRLFIELSKTFDKENDGILLHRMVMNILDEYREMPLPQTRTEFELRAELYRILQLIETLIDVKRDFITNRQ